MATTGVLNGTAMAIYVNGTKIAKLLSNGFSISRPTREVANKDSGDWISRKPNRASWGTSGSAHFEFGPTYGFEDLYSAIVNETQLWVMISTEVQGDNLYVGSAYLVTLEPDFPDMDNSSYSFSFEGDGSLTESSIT